MYGMVKKSSIWKKQFQKQELTYTNEDLTTYTFKQVCAIKHS